MYQRKTGIIIFKKYMFYFHIFDSHENFKENFYNVKYTTLL